jgi:hypothetical protein
MINTEWSAFMERYMTSGRPFVRVLFDRRAVLAALHESTMQACPHARWFFRAAARNPFE